MSTFPMNFYSDLLAKKICCWNEHETRSPRGTFGKRIKGWTHMLRRVSASKYPLSLLPLPSTLRPAKDGRLRRFTFELVVGFTRSVIGEQITSDMPPEAITHNVILFGEAGAGKSSIVNMLVGQNIAAVSNGIQACTFKNQCYEVCLDGTDFRIYDTVGLNEGDQGRVPHWRAIEGLYTLIRDLDGVSLLIYCLKGRAKENTEANWILFNKIICAEKVPIIAVVTGLEKEINLDDWWGRSENRKTLSAYRLKPLAVACVVSIRGKRDEYEEKYLESQEKLRRLIVKYYGKKPWSVEKDKWFAHIYQEVYTTAFCFSERVHLEFVSVLKNVVDEFIAETGMKSEDSANLQLSLLHAEKKIRKRKKKRFHIL